MTPGRAILVGGYLVLKFMAVLLVPIGLAVAIVATWFLFALWTHPVKGNPGATLLDLAPSLGLAFALYIGGFWITAAIFWLAAEGLRRRALRSEHPD